MMRFAIQFCLVSQTHGVVVNRQLEANGMTFECGVAGDGSNGDVLLIHGNEPVNKERFYDLMEYISAHGMRTVACDMRGYSPGASPQVYEAYNYNELAKDIFAIADVSGFDKFHVVAHDQGARLTWHSIAANAGRSRYLSVTSISIPHTDVFSESLYGPLADPIQQAGFQYMTVFTLNTPESVHWAQDKMHYNGGEAIDKVERRTWWYSGGVEAGNLALPPKAFDSQFPHSNPKYGDDGVPSTTKVGHVDMPVLYVCGDIDNCGKGFPFSSRTKALCDGAYTYVELPSCRHDILPCELMGNTTADALCEGSACGLHVGSGSKVWDAIMGNIALASATVV